jgi:LysR family transcriptional regulator for metE and metH
MLAQGTAGRLHIAIECHSCFDWLMPTMDSFRQRWPDVELDIMAGPNFDPMSLLLQGEADFVVCADPTPGAAVHYEQLFSYQALLAMATQHPLAAREFIEPQDLRDQTLIAYPVPEHRLDVFSHFLIPAQVQPRAVRSTELTAMILQLVASHRGVAALPSWVLSDYLRRDYVSARPLGGKGVWRSLYGAVRAGDAEIPYVKDFMGTARNTALRELDGIRE